MRFLFCKWVGLLRLSTGSAYFQPFSSAYGTVIHVTASSGGPKLAHSAAQKLRRHLTGVSSHELKPPLPGRAYVALKRALLSSVVLAALLQVG